MVNRLYQKPVLKSAQLHMAFKKGQDMMEDLIRSGRSATSATEVNIAKMKEM